MKSVDVSAGSRGTPAAVAAASSLSQHSTIALRGVPRPSADRWASASAVMAVADFVEHVEIDHPWWPAASGPAQLRPVPPCVSQEHGEQDCHADQEDDEQADPDGRRNLPRFRLHRGRRHHRVRCGRRDRGSGAAEIGTFGELHASGRGHGHEQHRHDRAGQRREHRPSIHRRNVLPRSDRADRPIRARRAGRCSAARSLPRHARRGRSPRRS